MCARERKAARFVHAREHLGEAEAEDEVLHDEALGAQDKELSRVRIGAIENWRAEGDAP
jgi:hypothetical protein